MFSSRSSTVSGLKFRFSIHFELDFVNGIREAYSLILLLMDMSFFQYHLLKKRSFSHRIFLAPLLAIK